MLNPDTNARKEKQIMKNMKNKKKKEKKRKEGNDAADEAADFGTCLGFVIVATLSFLIFIGFS